MSTDARVEHRHPASTLMCDNPECWESVPAARAAKYDHNPNHVCDDGHFCSVACYDAATEQVR